MKRLLPGNSEEKNIIRWCMILAGFLIVLDQLTKLVVVQYIKEHSIIPVIKGFFNLTYVNNPGAAWGILAGKGWILLTISILVLVLVIKYLRILTEGWPERYFAIFIIMGGIVGNSIDRIWRRQVVDFLDFCIYGYHWPAFNVADSAITIGIAIFIISSLKRPQDRISKEAGFIFFQKRK